MNIKLYLLLCVISLTFIVLSIFEFFVYLSFLIAILMVFINIRYRMSIPKKTYPIFILITFMVSMLFFKGIHGQLYEIGFYKNDGKLFITYILFMCFIIIFSYNKLNRIKTLKLILDINIFTIILSTVYNLYIGNTYNKAFFESHNASAGYIGVIIIIYNYLIINKIRLQKKYITYLIYVILFISFYYTQSRAFSLALLVSLFVQNKDRYKLSYKNVIKLLLIVILLLQSNLGQRFIRASSFDEYNVVTRFYYWKTAIDIFSEQPLFGIGIGSYNDFVIDELEIDKQSEINKSKGKFFHGERHAHNIILHVLAEQGLIGFFVFLYIFFYYLTAYKKNILYKLKNNLFIFLMLGSMFGINLFTPSTAVYFYMIIAMSLTKN